MQSNFAVEDEIGFQSRKGLLGKSNFGVKAVHS